MKKILSILIIAMFWNCSYAQVKVEYWSNKNKKSVGNYKDSLQDGMWTYWYENGQKWSEGEFKEGVKIGFWKYWYEDGKKWSEIHLDNGLNTSWFESGQKEKEGNIVNGKMDGVWKTWYSTKNLKEETHYKNGLKDGKSVSFYPDSSKEFVGAYIKDSLQGYATWWRKTGDKEMEGKSIVGLQDSIWIYYHENGKNGSREIL
jgi:antitoxin component YwqK of YwqJK toxin-antitoxin module